jgi:hypothetical protein
MAKGAGRQMEKQERTMAEFSRIARISSKPGYTQNRLVDKLIAEGAIRREEAAKKATAQKDAPVYAGKYASLYANQK